jgi:hypothetical protein
MSFVDRILGAIMVSSPPRREYLMNLSRIW